AAGRPLGIVLYLPEALFSDPRLSDEDVRELVAGELERARARAQASPLRPVQEEAFGDDQVRALMRLRPILAAGGPASAREPGRRDGPWSLARALLRFLGRITFIGPLLQTVLEPGFYAERDRFYSGTSMADLVDIVRGGGEMREGLTYVSDEPGFPFGYARSRGFARDAVGVVLQFDAAKLGGKLALGHYQPTAPVDRAGDRPDRLANFYVATQPIPLAALTEASKLSILRWIAGQMLAHPEDGSWEPLLRSFESALQYVYRPAAAGARLDATGVSRNRGVLLNVAGADALAPSLAFRGMSFAPKAELHVTMVDKAKTSAEQAAITDALRGARFSVTRTGRYRVARKDERVSIVELVDVAGLEAFYRRVEDSLGVARGTLTRPAPHVTLFTSPAGRGIGIDDEAAMAATEPVTDAAELAALGAAAP
ncbi:MAG TPA: hypothetical protein VNI01_09445, partial [Elusimicrobiota bacterium]|nr:hypothetical protein [Elusimicrobiota bacterium]